MNKLIIAAALASVCAVGASTATAATVYAQSVTSTNGTTTDTCTVQANNGDRSDICNALGAGDVTGIDSGFASVGLHDSLLFNFGTMFSGPITVWEVTGGLNANWLESVSFTLLNSETNATAAGVIATNVGNVADGANRWKIETMVAGLFDTLIVVDTTDTNPNFPANNPALNGDGFDIDAVSVNVAPVPVPASAALMLAGLGAFGVMRRRKTA